MPLKPVKLPEIRELFINLKWIAESPKRLDKIRQLQRGNI